jgi:hypothetical protein
MLALETSEFKKQLFSMKTIFVRKTVIARATTVAVAMAIIFPGGS